MVAAICRADGKAPTRLAIRCTTPPSLSVITNGASPAGADAASVRRLAARVAGADDPKRITPPAPAATSALTEATSLSATGTTRVCSASCVRLQPARTVASVQVFGVAVGDADGVPVATIDGVGRADVPGSAQAVRIDVAATMARSPGVVLRIRVIRRARGKGTEPSSRRAAQGQDDSQDGSMKFGVVLPGGTAGRRRRLRL